MHLTHLRYVQAIARHKSLSAAARSLGVSQPTLTGAVKSLEEELRTTIVLRGRDGVRLTTAGEALVRYAGEVLATVERMEQEIRGLESDARGRLVLGCHESLGAYFLPGFMRGFLETYAGIELTLWNGSSAAVRDAVLSREVHYGLLVNPIAHPDLVLVKLYHDAMDFFVCVDDPPTPALAEAIERVRRGPLVYAGRVTQCQELIQRLGADDTPPVAAPLLRRPRARQEPHPRRPRRRRHPAARRRLRPPRAPPPAPPGAPQHPRHHLPRVAERPAPHRRRPAREGVPRRLREDAPRGVTHISTPVLITPRGGATARPSARISMRMTL
jgi:molybdate transport repressor ModE-like protein